MPQTIQFVCQVKSLTNRVYQTDKVSSTRQLYSQNIQQAQRDYSHINQVHMSMLYHNVTVYMYLDLYSVHI